MMLVALALLIAAVGCGGGASNSEAEGEPATEPAPVETSEGPEDVFKQWGPTEMPSQQAQPLEFLYWRVDQMFERGDADQDGRISADEFIGESYNFERIDADADGFVTKKEVVDDITPMMREEGTIP